MTDNTVSILGSEIESNSLSPQEEGSSGFGEVSFEQFNREDDNRLAFISEDWHGSIVELDSLCSPSPSKMKGLNKLCFIFELSGILPVINLTKYNGS